jgi:hypothetical protein
MLLGEGITGISCNNLEQTYSEQERLGMHTITLRRIHAASVTVEK